MKTCYAFLFMLLLSCNGTNQNTTDSTVVEETTSKNYVDSFHNALLSQVEFDTIGVDKAPVQISHYQVVEPTARYKSVSLTYKNISAKNIKAIRFKWYGTDRSGAPVGMGYAATGIGGSFDDEPLHAGKERTAVWGVLTNQLNVITRVWPTEVVFEDGSKWVSGR